jgi:hypothetical protein
MQIAQLGLAILNFLKTSGLKALPFLILGILTIILFRIALDEDRSALFRSKFYRALYRVSGKKEHEKKYIANDIMGRLNLARREMHFGEEILPRAIDVEWVSGETGTAFDIKEGEFIVRLDPSEKQPKNISLLTCALVKRSTLLGIRHLIEKPLQAVLDLNLVRNLLKDLGKSEVLDWFMANEYVPMASGDSRTRLWNDQVTIIDERGLFTRLLLVELERFAKEVAGKPPRLYMTGEIEGLISFLYQICNRRYGERVPLDFLHALIRIRVIIFAQTAKALRDLAPYIKAMEIGLRSEPTAIYVLAFDKEWLGEIDPEAYAAFEDQIKSLGSDLEKASVATKTHDLKYSCVDQDGHRRIARLIRFVPPHS